MSDAARCTVQCHCTEGRQDVHLSSRDWAATHGSRAAPSDGAPVNSTDTGWLPATVLQ